MAFSHPPFGLAALMMAGVGAFAQAPNPGSKMFNAYYAQWTVYNGYTVKTLDTSGTAKRLNMY